MTNISALEKAAQRRVARFEHKYGAALLHLAYHVALPAALNADLVHLLRINFFFDGTKSLPYTAEADLLLSPLCSEIGNELYEMDHEVRDILLQGLSETYGRERLREVASLLWQYDRRFAPWSDRDMLERAQQLTALSFLDPARAREWLIQQSTEQRSIEHRVWFTAMSREVSLAEKIPSIPVEQTEPTPDPTSIVNAEEDQPQIPSTTQVEQPIVAEFTPDDKTNVNQQQTMIDEQESTYVGSSPQDAPVDPSTPDMQAITEEQPGFVTRIDPVKLRNAILQTFSLPELGLLCVDIEQELRLKGIEAEPLRLDVLSGQSLPSIVQSLIKHCERRGWLGILIREVKKARPNIDIQEIEKAVQEAPSNVQSSTSEEEKLVPGDKERSIGREQHNRLVELLLKVPNIGDFAVRSALLAGIPSLNSLPRSFQNTLLDITNIIYQLIMLRLPTGQSALLVFIDNAIQFVDGTTVGEDLKELRHQLEAIYGQMEQEPSSQEHTPNTRSTQSQTNAPKESRASKKNNPSKEKQTTSGGEHMASQSDSGSNITKELKEFRQVIEGMEAQLDTIPPRLHTTRTLTTYETELQKVLVAIRNALTSKMPKVAVLNCIRDARDELTLAIQEFSDNGINKDFIFYIRQCRDNLENALKLWS